jgi:hypothetical protein
MRKKVFYPTIALALLLGLGFAVHAEMSSTNYRIPASVLSSGGTTMDSATYQVTATIGQSSCIGLSSRRNYINYAGFWQPETEPREGMFYIIPNNEGGGAVIYLD